MLNLTELCGFGAGDSKPLSTQWRIRGNGVTALGFTEIEMKDGGADQCNGGTASWNSTFWAAPSALFDNDLGTNGGAGVNTLIDGVNWAWIQYTFPSAVSVSSLVLTSYNSWCGETLLLEYYDGSAWIVLKTFTGIGWTSSFETKTLTV